MIYRHEILLLINYILAYDAHSFEFGYLSLAILAHRSFLYMADPFLHRTNPINLPRIVAFPQHNM